MKSICICGSKKFAPEISSFAKDLTSANVLVFEPNFKQPLPEDAIIHNQHITNIIFKGLTLEHFDWIRKADTCYIYNKDGYVGVSVTMEMAFAHALSKPIFALEPKTGDPCRDALIDKVFSSTKQLIKYLQ